FLISLNGLISPPSMRTDVPVIHFAGVEGTSAGSSCSDAIIVFSWFRKSVAIPWRRAGFSLRCGQRAVIEKLDGIFREENVPRPIVHHTYLLSQARKFAPVKSPTEKPSKKSGEV